MGARGIHLPLAPLFRRPIRAPDSSAPKAAGTRLRLLSYNIQVGIATRRYRHYVLHSWKHVIPHTERLINLDTIGRVLSDYDLVCLQEVDGGSLRTDFVNQIEYLARRGHFPYWYQQTNRRIGNITRHSNGLLSQVRPREVQEHTLPGFIPGRGALAALFGIGEEELLVVNLHLAIGRVARLRQLSYVAELVQAHRHCVVMGDFNLHSKHHDLRRFVAATGLSSPDPALSTFPSWRPNRNLDHILVTPGLRAENVRVVDFPLSDHLPIALDLVLPFELSEPNQESQRAIA